MGRVILLFLVLLLATLGVSLGAPPKPSGLPKLGIVSAIGDTFYARKTGLGFLGNDFKEMPIAAWGIDEMMTAKLRAALSPRFDVRPVTYKRAAFAIFPDRSGFLAQNFRPEVVREVSPQGLDAYLIVVKSERSSGGSSRPMFQGLGSTEGNTDVDPIMFVHAYYNIYLVDGRDFRIKSQAGSHIPRPFNPFVREAFSSPARKVDASMWPTSLNAAEHQKLKGVVVELIDQSLPPTLEKLLQ
jgi:hypothetical protein